MTRLIRDHLPARRAAITNRIPKHEAPWAPAASLRFGRTTFSRSYS
jgi:hypothetical protein